LKAGKTNGSGVEFIETPPPNFVTTSTSTPIICTQMVNYKGKNRGLNQTHRDILTCESDHSLRKFHLPYSLTIYNYHHYFTSSTTTILYRNVHYIHCINHHCNTLLMRIPHSAYED
ncbi:hypothetical protein T02_13148, partial [Trichinella nativa]